MGRPVQTWQMCCNVAMPDEMCVPAGHRRPDEVSMPTPARRNMPLHLPLFLTLHLPPPLHCGRVASASGSGSASTSASASTVSRNRKCFIFKCFPLDGNRKCLNKGTHGRRDTRKGISSSQKRPTRLFDLICYGRAQQIIEKTKNLEDNAWQILLTRWHILLYFAIRSLSP